MIMQGLMMDFPLTLTAVMRHAASVHAGQRIVSINADTTEWDYSYREMFARAAQFSHALAQLGVKPGDVIASLAWNDHRHLESYYAIPCMGAVLHTINPRLFDDQIEYIINHGQAQWILIDPEFVPLINKLRAKLPQIKGFIVLANEADYQTLKLDQAWCYETLLLNQVTEYPWPDIDENQACTICYTSGTTGNPKGVVFSHRSTVLTSMNSNSAASVGLSEQECVMPVVPMFHVNAWNMPYSVPMCGAKLVLPGRFLGDSAVLCRLMQSHGVTMAAAVPTVWLSLLEYLRANQVKLNTVKRFMVGGAATPIQLMRDFELEQNVFLQQGWGMTELNPLGTMNVDNNIIQQLQGDEHWQKRATVGRPTFGIECRIVDDQLKVLPWDGKLSGKLQVRGPWVCKQYLGIDAAESYTSDGWFDTGDMASIDNQGYVSITDRVKDLIKSGGEWISSNEIENHVMSYPGVSLAAVFAVPHAKWTERPWLCVVAKPNVELKPDDLLNWLKGKIAKWWLPDGCDVVPDLPLTATGKIDKKSLRQSYQFLSVTE